MIMINKKEKLQFIKKLTKKIINKVMTTMCLMIMS